MSKRIGLYPRVRVEGGGRGAVSQAGAVLLVETVRKSGLDTAISAAMAPWRKPRTVHDPGKVLLDVALATALGGDCLADVAMLRAEADVFGPVASDPTVSRLIDTLAAAGPKALTAIRTARAEVRTRVWELAGEDSPAAGGSVIVDIDGVLVLAHSEKQDATATWKKSFGHHPLVAFVDHGQAGISRRYPLHGRVHGMRGILGLRKRTGDLRVSRTIVTGQIDPVFGSTPPQGELVLGGNGVRMVVAMPVHRVLQQLFVGAYGARRVPRRPAHLGKVVEGGEGLEVIDEHLLRRVDQRQHFFVGSDGTGRVPGGAPPSGEAGAGNEGVRVVLAQHPHAIG